MLQKVDCVSVEGCGVVGFVGAEERQDTLVASCLASHSIKAKN